MSSERIMIGLAREGDDWSCVVVGVTPDDEQLLGQRRDGSGPADVLEQLGQTLDERDVDRIRRERDI